MRDLILLAVVAASIASCTSGPSMGDALTTTTTTSSVKTETTMAAFRPVRELGYGQHFGSDRHVSLPVPVRRPAGVRLALLLIGDVVAHRNLTAKQADEMANGVTVPLELHYLDPRTGTVVEQSLSLDGDDRIARFGIPDPVGYLVGRFDDPKWLPKDRLGTLRERIYSALDILLPFFVDENRPWTEEATRAAQEVRDFFPLAAEPGLWPYYRAEGKLFFAWVEKHAPAARAPLPWEVPGDPPSRP